MSDPLKMTEPPDRLAPEALAQLAVDIVDGRTYFTNTLEGVQYSFGLVLSLADLSAIADFIGGFYAPMAEALPRGINGFPMFMTASMLHLEDFEPLMAKIGEYEEQKKAFIS